MYADWKLEENNAKGHKSQYFSSCAASTPAHGKSCSCRDLTAVADFCEGALNMYQNSKESDIWRFRFLTAWVLVPPALAHELNTCFSISLPPLIASIFALTVSINLFLPAPFPPLSPSVLYWRTVDLPRVDQSMGSNKNKKKKGFLIFAFKSGHQVVQLCIVIKLIM